MKDRALRIVGALGLVLALVPQGAVAQSHASPDLTGVWTNATATPLERPPTLGMRATFTSAEAAEFERTVFDRALSALPSDADRLVQVDLNDTYQEILKVDRLRTSLIVDPPDGRLPPALSSVQVRAAARPARTFDGPETLSLAERCLLGNVSNSSAGSPPLVPGPAISPYYQILQTDTTVMIFSEWMHDARIVRLNGQHQPADIRSWLGDSVGQWDGSTLVVDTTNFRSDVHNQGSGERLHVVERFTRTNANTITYRVTVSDPDSWASSWTAEELFRSTNAQLFEFACHEANYSMENILRGARFTERANASPDQTRTASPR